MRKKYHIRPVLALSLAMGFVTASYAGQQATTAPEPDRAQSIVQSGNERGAPPCTSCHGAKGEGNPFAGVPRLAGLPEQYLAHALTTIKKGSRSNPLMSPVAKLLSDEEIQQLSHYFAHQPVPQRAKDPQPNVPASQIMQGRKLVLQGDWSRNIPACTQCHSLDDKGVGSQIPAITGQSYNYIFNQLTAWKQGARDNGPLDLMGPIAQRMTEEEAQAVARYLSQQQEKKQP